MAKTTKFEAAVAEMKKRRDAAIDELIAKSSKKVGTNQDTNRVFYAVMYDMEFAPKTTNRAQLALLDIYVPPSDDVTPEGLPALIMKIANALAMWGTYLTGTDNMSDRALYERLSTSVLDESIPELPPNQGACEYIDFEMYNDGTPVDRDSKLPRDPKIAKKTISVEFAKKEATK